MLIPIPKIKKREEDIASYRSICLLSVFSKIVEALIEKRLRDEIKDNGGLYEKQYGFREKRSTIHAVEEVRNIVRETSNKAPQHKKVSALVTIALKIILILPGGQA